MADSSMDEDLAGLLYGGDAEMPADPKLDAALADAEPAAAAGGDGDGDGGMQKSGSLKKGRSRKKTPRKKVAGEEADAGDSLPRSDSMKKSRSKKKKKTAKTQAREVGAEVNWLAGDEAITGQDLVLCARCEKMSITCVQVGSDEDGDPLMYCKPCAKATDKREVCGKCGEPSDEGGEVTLHNGAKQWYCRECCLTAAGEGLAVSPQGGWQLPAGLGGGDDDDDVAPVAMVPRDDIKAPFAYQFRAVLAKNLSLQKRAKCSCCAVMILPILIVCLIGALDLVVRNLVSDSTAIMEMAQYGNLTAEEIIERKMMMGQQVSIEENDPRFELGQQWLQNSPSQPAKLWALNPNELDIGECGRDDPCSGVLGDVSFIAARAVKFHMNPQVEDFCLRQDGDEERWESGCMNWYVEYLRNMMNSGGGGGGGGGGGDDDGGGGGGKDRRKRQNDNGGGGLPPKKPDAVCVDGVRMTYDEYDAQYGALTFSPWSTQLNRSMRAEFNDMENRYMWWEVKPKGTTIAAAVDEVRGILSVVRAAEEAARKNNDWNNPDVRCVVKSLDHLLPKLVVSFDKLEMAASPPVLGLSMLVETQDGEWSAQQLSTDLEVLFQAVEPRAGLRPVRVMRGAMPKVREQFSFSLDVGLVIGPNLFAIALSFLLPVYVNNIVSEKQEKLREMMKMAGLSYSSYWLNNYLYDLVLYLVVIIPFIGIGYAFSLRYFTETAFGVLALLYGGWGIAQIGVGFVFSTFFGRSRTALVVVYVLTLLTVVIASVLNSALWGYSFTDRQITVSPLWWRVYPPLAFYRGVSLIALHCLEGQCLQELPPVDSEWTVIWISLYGGALVLPLLGIYLDQVLPSKYGVRKNPAFCLTDPCMNAECAQRGGGNDLEEARDEEMRALMDEDVKEELARVTEGKANNDMVVVKRLHKRFPGGKVAVKSLSISFKSNQCFGLLGPNGAGKTTAISVLTGLIEPTSGEATIAGFRIADQMDSIHKVIGVCPQFDTLWPSLTVQETLLFYVRLKGVFGKPAAAAVDRSLEDVELTAARTKRVSELSGGMRRRLSIAIALLGNPSAVFLDEPTTGLDPVTRKSLWDVLKRATRGRCIILTTHSMEEADSLCQRIGIMTLGELACIGTNVHLKSKFGSGYYVRINFNVEDEQRATEFITGLLPKATLSQSFPGNHTYQIATKELMLGRTLSHFFDQMSNHHLEHGVKDWGITESSLEDVFLTIAERSEAAK